MDRLRQFFSGDYAAPHGFCFMWNPEILWTHIIADTLIALAYFSIPLALWRFAKKRPDMPFHKIFILFATFITLCGLTHVFGIFVLWFPYYGPQGLLMLATGIVSAITAFLVWRILPSAITLPSPSELAEMNKQLAHSYEETERQVWERTKELEAANSELTKARQKADEASLAKGEFLANMSHEIRTPLNVVTGVSDILANSDPLTEKQREYISVLKANADSLLALINDVLDLTRIESRQPVLDSMPFNLFNKLEEVRAAMSLRATEKGLKFTLDVADESFKRKTYLGDPNRLRQVLINLCGNAIKFTHKGSIVLSLASKGTDDKGTETVELKITDTGIGIQPDKKDAVFEKFVQADSSINRKYGGTGLGLSIVKTLVELMGGTIDLQSTLGHGTVFTVALPLQITHRPVDAKSDGDLVEESIERPRKILLVEDYAPNVLVATTFLERYGYECDVATSGIEAVEKRLVGNYALILMDVQMPGMNGFEATKEIRRNESEQQLPHIPIIGMTAHAYKADREKCLASGMDDYLAKPYEAKELHKKVQALLE